MMKLMSQLMKQRLMTPLIQLLFERQLMLKKLLLLSQRLEVMQQQRRVQQSLTNVVRQNKNTESGHQKL